MWAPYRSMFSAGTAICKTTREGLAKERACRVGTLTARSMELGSFLGLEHLEGAMQLVVLFRLHLLRLVGGIAVFILG